MEKKKKLVATIHHIVPEKFFLTEKERDFHERDKLVDWYHVPCKKTKNQISELTSKPIFTSPFWVNQNLWFKIKW